MPKRKAADTIRALEALDDMLFILTGKRLPHYVETVFGALAPEELKEYIQRVRGTAPSDDPYAVLGIARSSPDLVVKSAYRALVRRHHPDMGGNPETFKQIQTAYEAINRERENRL